MKAWTRYSALVIAFVITGKKLEEVEKFIPFTVSD